MARRLAPAVLALAEPGKEPDEAAPAGAIQIATAWFAVHRAKGKLVLDKDEQDLFSVWAGSAWMLAAAARYVEADPLASFPVRSDLTWADEQHLGKLPVAANGASPSLPATVTWAEVRRRRMAVSARVSAALGGIPVEVDDE